MYHVTLPTTQVRGPELIIEIMLIIFFYVSKMCYLKVDENNFEVFL